MTFSASVLHPLVALLASLALASPSLARDLSLETDWEADGIADWDDNCPATFNPGQADGSGGLGSTSSIRRITSM